MLLIFYQSLTYMINHEIPTKNTGNQATLASIPISYNDQDSPSNTLVFSQSEFVHWCSTMTIQELEVCFRVQLPDAVALLRKNCQGSCKNWTFELCELANLDKALASFAINTYRKFIQALLFVSGKEYLDSITFNSDCLLYPNKVYKLLSTSKHIAMALSQHLEAQTQSPQQQHRRVKNPQLQPCAPRTVQLLADIIEKVQKNLEHKMKLHTKFKLKNQQKPETLINQFNMYWKYCSDEQKESIWYLGYNDIKRAAMKSLDVDYKIDVNQIEEYVLLAQKVGMRELSQRIFSWKIGRNDNGIVDYMNLIFNQLKDRALKKNGLSPKQKNKKTKKKKIRERAVRRQSIDESSNQTNQTDIIYERAFDINIDQVIHTKIEKDIVRISDQINEEANLYYDNREMAFERLKDVLACINCVPKLYGSCCVGLAIKNSDVDVTIDEAVLNQYYGYYGGTLECIAAFFQYLEYYFANFPWISNVKVIKSATIPIIKFTIDNSIPYTPPVVYSIEANQKFNRKIEFCGPVQIDLTIQTTEPSRKHLGVISTRQTEEWLKEIPTLQAIAVIIKRELAQKVLNQTYYGGLNTYTLLVLLVAVIRKEKLGKEDKISIVFERVLKFYSEEFEEEKYGIDLNCEQIFYQKVKQPQENSKFITEPDKNRQLEVKDPQGDHRNMTRNCYQFKKIKKIFADLYSSCFTETRIKIEELCSAWNPKQNPLDQDSLLEWVEKRVKEGDVMEMLKLE